MDADLTALNQLISEMRPRLHRYCARMVGSAFDGEDVVQDALANAAAAYSARIDRPEAWLFRIAHNAALDALRRRKRTSAFESDADVLALADETSAADARASAESSLALLQTLTPVERSSVVLMDVLGYAIAETAEILSITTAAVKAALHRGRARLKSAANEPAPATTVIDPAERERLRAYADRFNARDFDALRDLLAEDVRLDLVNRLRLKSRKEVSVYFTRYSELQNPLHAAVGLAEGRPALLFRGADDPAHVAFVVLLEWKDGAIAAIRDFHYARYVMDSLNVADAP